MDKDHTHERSLDEAVRHFLFEESTLFCVVLDDEGVIVSANGYARETVGGDPVGRAFSSLLVDFARTFSLAEVLKEREPTLLTISTASGVPWSYYFRFVPSVDGILAFGEVNSRELESLQRNLMELNTQFSNMSRELQKKTAELEKLNEVKNQFIGTAAHDLRNPIGAIRNLSEFLLEDPDGTLDSRHREVLTMISTSSRFILSLVDDLLNIAKIESGKLTLSIQYRDLSSFIRDTFRINRLFAEKKNVSLRLNQYEELPPIPFDEVKLEQVMNNLLSNAIKYSPRGGEVAVSVFRSGERVTVTVRDQGPGIPEEERIHLFKPFSTTSAEVPEGETSTGLGLAIARNIVVGHLGEIGIGNSEGGGAEFYFSLPLESTVGAEKGRPG